MLLTRFTTQNYQKKVIIANTRSDGCRFRASIQCVLSVKSMRMRLNDSFQFFLFYILVYNFAIACGDNIAGIGVGHIFDITFHVGIHHVDSGSVGQRKTLIF